MLDQTDLNVEESLTLTGVHAAYMRDYLLQVPESSRRTVLQNQMEMGDADLTDLKIDSLNIPGEPLRLHFTYSLKKQFRRSDNQIRGVPRAGFARIYLTASPVEPRLTPFEITIPLSIDFSEIVDVPAGFEAVQPESLDLKLDPRFATGDSSARVEGRQLNLHFKCRLITGRFVASDYSAYRQTMSQILSIVEREVVFKAGGH